MAGKVKKPEVEKIGDTLKNKIGKQMNEYLKYIVKELVLPDINERDVEIEITSKICLSHNHLLLHEEPCFEYRNCIIDKEEYALLEDITRYAKDKKAIVYIFEKIEHFSIPYLKLIHFFISESYLKKDIVPDEHSRVLSYNINELYKVFLEVPVTDILIDLFRCKLKQYRKGTCQIIITSDFDTLNPCGSLSFFSFLKRHLRFLLRGKIIPFIIELPSCFFSNKYRKFNYYLREDIFVKSQFVRNIAFWHIERSNKKYDDLNVFKSNIYFDYYRYLKNNQIENGIHLNYDTMENPMLMNEQLEKFEKMFGFKPVLNRFHYLRISNINDLQLLDGKIAEDYTYCFADHPYFRGGRCRPVKLWIEKENRTSNVTSFPLNIMDTTLSNYMNLSFSQAQLFCENYIDIAMIYGKSFVTLWHNRSLYRYGYYNNYQPKLYKFVVSNLINHKLREV